MPSPSRDSWSRFGTAVLGASLGGVVGGLVVVAVILVLKAGIDFAGTQDTWYVVVVPLLGLALTVLVLQGLGTDKPGAAWWRTFPRSAIRADISSDVIDSAGEEERFPWRLAPIRTLAIIATVASGGAMGTEAPAAYLGVAADCALADRGRWWRRLLRPASLAGGAAGVSALMALPLVGTVFMLELGRRRQAPLSAERVAAALIGGFIGWGINATFNLNLIRLVVPKEAPGTFAQAAITALCIGIASGVISRSPEWRCIGRRSGRHRRSSGSRSAARRPS